MPSLLFWNVQRLGQGTDDEMKTGLETVVNAQSCSYQAYCEVLQNCDVVQPFNPTYRKPNAYQLCYAARRKDGTAIPMTRVTPTSTNEYTNAGYKGGNNFTKLVDRAPADIGVLDGINVYLFHAPAYESGAERAVAFLVCWLSNHHGANPWLLIGDLNVDPGRMSEALDAINLPPSIKTCTTGHRTHQGSGELDYAVTNVPNRVNVKRVRANHNFNWSDHFAIYAEWT